MSSAQELYIPPKVPGWPIFIPESTVRKAPASLGSSASLNLYCDGPDMLLFGEYGADLLRIVPVDQGYEKCAEVGKENLEEFS